MGAFTEPVMGWQLIMSVSILLLVTQVPIWMAIHALRERSDENGMHIEVRVGKAEEWAADDAKSLHSTLTKLNAYAARNIKRIDDELEAMKDDVAFCDAQIEEALSIAWRLDTEVEQLKLSPLKRWARGVIGRAME